MLQNIYAYTIKAMVTVLLLPMAGLVSYAQQPYTLKGWVVAAPNGEPVAGANLLLLKQGARFSGNSQGWFELPGYIPAHDTLVVSCTGYITAHIPMGPANMPDTLRITLITDAKMLEETIVSTGYQQIRPGQVTGSAETVNERLLNRSMSAGVLERLDGVVPGLLFPKDGGYDYFTIRGRSTINTNALPLIVVDNFPYDGNLNNINPNDVASITILKDAGAASIWGARAGNGVVVITTKKGSTPKPRVSVRSNLMVDARPHIKDLPVISPPDYIELERTLFEKGFYSSAETNPGYAPLQPVTEILIQQRDGLISAAEANRQIEQLTAGNLLNDIYKYLYQPALSSQNAVSVSGSARGLRYYLSAGYDENKGQLAGVRGSRFTLRSVNSFDLSQKLELSATIHIVQDNGAQNGNPGLNISAAPGKGMYPYASLVTATGEPATLVKNYRESFAGQAEKNGLLNWQYQPLADMDRQENKSAISDMLLQGGLKWKLLRWLNIEAAYQLEKELSNNTYHLFADAFAVRDMVNRFTQAGANGVLSYPVPPGGQLTRAEQSTIAHQFRIRANYRYAWAKDHEISGLLAAEAKTAERKSNQHIFYGYLPNGSTVTGGIDFITRYPMYYNPAVTSAIPNNAGISRKNDRFTSLLFNGAYAFKQRYTTTFSVRKDASNLFGVKTNQRATPLWSYGISWQASKEPIYPFNWLPSLTFRFSKGTSGNIMSGASAYTIARYSTSTNTNLRTATITAPQNDGLRWERLKTTNLGVDFSFRNDIVTGGIEYYKKQTIDMFGQIQTDPTTGFITTTGYSYYYGNTASMKGSGIDLKLNFKIIDRKIKWDVFTFYSITKDKVTGYDRLTSSGSSYLAEMGLNPLAGYPVNSVFSYKWAGLDPQTGDPRGYNADTATGNYTLLLATLIDSMVYNGPAKPAGFGGLRPQVGWRGLMLSFNITGRLGYYARVNSVNYNSLVNSWTGHSDYAKRWKQPGDERHTDVPSFIYPASASQRDYFYNNTSVLVIKAGSVRWEDVIVQYTPALTHGKGPFSSATFTIGLSQLNILLWSNNNKNTDPLFIHSARPGVRAQAGIHFTF